MKKKTRKILLEVLIPVVCVAGLLAGAYYGLAATAKDTDAAWRQIGPIDLNQIADGVYNGKAGAFLCSADLNVTVKDHRIVSVDVNGAVNGGGKYAAEGITGRFAEAQSPDVDAVSGATMTSKTYMLAVYNALKGQGD